MTAKYKKDTVSSTSTKSTATKTTNVSVRQGRTTTAQRTGSPQRTPLVEDTRPDKVVPAAKSVAPQGIAAPAINAEAIVKERTTGEPAVSKDLLDREISRDPETGKWDMNKDMQGWSNAMKFVQGLVSPYEQPVQLVKNVIDNVPAERQMVKETGLDLLINPVIETVAGAKDLGITDKNFYWPDQLTGLDYQWAPAFLRSGGGSGSDIIGGLGQNLGYLQDVVTSEKTGAIIGQGYDESGERFMQQPAMYIGSAIGEVPLWFIGVGQAKAAVTISSKLAVTSVKMTAATGKLPGPATIKAIVQTERAANAVDKNVIKAKSLLVDADQGKIVNAKLPKNLDRAVNAALNVIKKDQDIPLNKKIKDATDLKNSAKQQQKILGEEISAYRSAKKNSPLSQSEKADLDVMINSNHNKIKELQKKWKAADNSIKLNKSKLNIAKLRKEFKDFKRQNKSSDNNIARSSKAQYIEWIETKIQPEITRKYKELPNQVDVIRDTKIAHLQSSISGLKNSANKLVGSKNIDQSFWEQSKIHEVGKQLGDKVTPRQRKKLIKLRNRKLDLELEMQRMTTNENWSPFGNTIRTLENIPGKTQSSWRNRWKTQAKLDGDNDIFGVSSDGKLIKMDDVLENVDGKTPLQPEQRKYGGQSGRLWKMLDYHRDNISRLRNRQVTAIAEELRNQFLDVGWIKKTDFISAQKQIDETVKPKIQKELDKLVDEREILQTQKTDLKDTGVTFTKYTTKSRGPTTGTMNTKMDSSIQRKIDDLDVSISKKDEEISAKQNLLDKADSYIGSNLSGVVPGRGSAKDKYYFEPSFLKQYMGDEYQKIMPEEILYPKRPIVKATRFGNEIEVQLGSNFSSPSGMVEGIVSVKAPTVPKGKIRKTLKRFTPHNKIRNRGMTLDNTEFIFTKQADNPVATDAIRIPANAPDDIKDMLTRGYYQKVSEDGPNIKFLKGLTGGETSELWTARAIPDKNKDPNMWDQRDINVGYTSKVASKDSQLDKANNMLRSYNEIMDTRAVLTGDKNLIRDNRIATISKNIESSAKEIESLNKKRGLDDVVFTGDEKKRLSFLKKEMDKDRSELTKLQKLADSQADDEFLLAKYGIGFGQRRGLVGRYDMSSGKNTKPINQSPVIKNQKTGKFYYVAEINNQKKIYELDNPDVADRIRPTNTEIATMFPDDMYGATEKGLVYDVAKIEAPGASRAAVKGSTFDKDAMIRFGGPITGRKATKKTTSKFQEENDIVLGTESAASLKQKGIRELTTAEVSEFEKGSTFSNLVGKIRDDLRGIDTGPDKVGEGVSKSIKKQMSDFIKINARTKTLSALESGSSKARKVKQSIVGDDDWVMMQKTTLRIDDDMYENLVSGGSIRTGSDDLSYTQKALSSSKEPLVSKSDVPDTPEQTSKLTWMPVDEIDSKKIKPTGLDMYNVIDLGVIGGRKRGDIDSQWVRDSVTRREYDAYLKAEGEKNAYEELLFAAKLNDKERTFRTNLVIAYEEMQGKKYYDTPDDNVRTETPKTSKAEIDAKIEKMIKYEIDDKTKLETFIDNNDYTAMVNDIVKNNLLREVTLKDRAKVVGRRGAKPNAKTVEQRAGLISIKYNFGNLSESLPSHSLVGRITNRAVSKLQSTDNFFSGGLLTGFREKLRYKFDKKTSVDEWDDPENLVGFHRAVEYMKRNNLPVDREIKAKYDATKGRVDSRYASIEMARENRLNSYIEDKGGVSMWVEGDLTAAEKLRVKQLSDKMDSIDRYLNNAKKQNPNAPLTREGRKEFENAKAFLDPEFRGPVPDEVRDMWEDIGELTTTYSKPGSDKTELVSLASSKITQEQRVKRLEQASIELALEKTKLEKKYIDSNEYASYSVKIRELQQEKANLQGFSNTFGVQNTRPRDTRFKTLFGDKRGVNMFSKQSDIDEYIGSLDFNIRYLKAQQGKPTHTTAMGKTSLTADNSDDFFTIKDSSDNVIAQGSDLRGSQLPQSVLKEMQKRGVFDSVVSKDTKLDDKARVKAWDKITGGADLQTRNTKSKELLENNNFIVEDVGFSGEVIKVTKGKTTTYHYQLPNISGQSDSKWLKLQTFEKMEEYNKQGFDIRKVRPAEEFKANRQQIPDERGTLVQSRYHEETIKAIDEWQAADPASKRSNKPITQRFVKWRDNTKKDLGQRVKPTNIRFGEEGIIENVTFDLLKKKNVVAPGGKGLNREEFFMADIGSTGKNLEKDMRIETAKQSYLKDMGVDTKALMPMKKILDKMKTKKNSLNEINDARSTLLDPTTTPTARKRAQSKMNTESASVSAIDNELSRLQSAYATQKPQTTISQKRQMPAPSDVRVKFFSFSQSDLKPDYRGQSKSKGISVPFTPAYAETPLGVNVTPNPVATQDTKKDESFMAYADSAKQQQSVNTKSVTDITSGLDLSLPGLLSGMKIGPSLRPLQTEKNTLDTNLGWLAAQLPGQITRPDTDVSAVTAMRLDSILSSNYQMKLRVSATTKVTQALRQTQDFGYKFRVDALPFKKYKDVQYQSIRQRQPRSQVILPVMLGPLPWELAEERARKRKKKPKRKSAKTWWQTPENWYESNYWGKSGTGSGYVTFKGSEPKRLKDRKNQFGF